MPWQTIAAIVGIIVAVGSAAYKLGALAELRERQNSLAQRLDGTDREIERARNRIDQMESDLRDWMTYWKRQ